MIAILRPFRLKASANLSKSPFSSLKYLLLTISLFLFTLPLVPIRPALAQIEQLKWDHSPATRVHPFKYGDPTDPYMRRLRDEYGIDAMTKGAGSDFDRARIITSWVHEQWYHKGDVPLERCDAIGILEKARNGTQFSCREYAIVTAQCLASVGIKARIVGLIRKDIANHGRGAYHYVTEAYLKGRQKWAMFDAQWDAVPTVKNYPLNCAELQSVLANRVAGLDFGNLPDTMLYLYPDGLGAYLYSLHVMFDNRPQSPEQPFLEEGGLVLVPLGRKAPPYRGYTPMPLVSETHSLTEFYQKP